MPRLQSLLKLSAEHSEQRELACPARQFVKFCVKAGSLVPWLASRFS
jgi:hypothetical protein